MIRKILFILIFFSLLSCYHENKEVVATPENMLSKDEMVDILTDIQLSEGILTFRRIEKLPVTNYGESLYNKVIDEHHITRHQLQENIDFYNNDPKLMEKIYEEVLARLTKMQSELIAQAARSDSIQKFKNDSIQMLDSVMHMPFINMVLIQEKDTLAEEIDSVYWKYQESIIIPDFIY